MRRFLSIASASACFFALVAVCAQESEQDVVLARINSSVITRTDVDKLLAITGDLELLERRFHGPVLEEEKDKLFKQVLGGLIEEAVIRINADRDDVQLDDSDRKRAQEQIRRFAGQYGSEANCELVLNRRGCSLKDARERVAKSMLAEKYIKAKLKVTHFVAPKETRQFFVSNQKLLKEVVERQKVVIRQIVVKHGRGRRSKSEAAELVAQIKEAARDGEDFATLARKHSEGPRRDEDGLWEPVAISDFREKVAEEISRLAEGEVSEIIDRGDDFALVKVEKKDDPFESALNPITRALSAAREQKKLRELMCELYSCVEIELYIGGVKLADICPNYSVAQDKESREMLEEISP